MGPYREKNMPGAVNALALVVVLMVMYQPWQLMVQELSASEGFFAVQAMELSGRNYVVTAHGMAIQNAYPLYPLLVSVLWKYSHLPLELVMRLISVFFTLAAGLIVYIGAANMRSPRAGLIAAAAFLTCNLTMEKAIEGFPLTMSLFFVLLADMLFFYYSMRKNNWDMAWLSSLFFASLAFLSGGFFALLAFAVPLLFLRRPMSIKNRFGRPGFIVGIIVLALTVTLWLLPYYLFSHDLTFQYFWWHRFLRYSYFADLLTMPADFLIRYLPWTLLAWIPFCVALRNVDETPIYSMFLRTLVIAGFFLIWLFPETENRDMLYFIAPLSILIGINYDTALRRYGYKMRKFQFLAEFFLLHVPITLVVFCLLPKKYLELVVSLTSSIEFRTGDHYLWYAGTISVIIITVFCWVRRRREIIPFWSLLTLLAMTCGLMFWATIFIYRTQESPKRAFGATVANALKGETVDILYKGNISDLYGELYYANFKIKKIGDLSDLPKGANVVYLLNTEFPQLPERNWTNLLKNNDNAISYRGHKLYLWKGVLRDESADSGDSAE